MLQDSNKKKKILMPCKQVFFSIKVIFLYKALKSNLRPMIWYPEAYRYANKGQCCLWSTNAHIIYFYAPKA